jgi:predicted ATPase
MLETLRDYALEQLEAGGQAEAVRARHAAHFAALAEEAGTALWDPVQGPQRAFWLRRLSQEYDNLQTALAWAERNDGETLLRMVASLADYWLVRNSLAESRAWLTRALDHPGATSTAARARALHAAAFVAESQGDREHSVFFAEESLDLYRTLEDREGVGRTLHLLGQIVEELGDHDRALAYAQESLALARELGHVRGVIVSLSHLGQIAARTGEPAEAAALLAEARALADEHEDETALATIALRQSALARAEGSYQEARSYLEDGIRVAEAYDIAAAAAECVQCAALLAEAMGRPEQSARLSGAAAAIREELGVVAEPEQAAGFEQAWDEGFALTRAEALALARSSGEVRPA